MINPFRIYDGQRTNQEMDSNRETHGGKYMEMVLKDSNSMEPVTASDIQSFILLAKETNFHFGRIIERITDFLFAREVAMLVLGVERLRDVVNKLEEKLPESFLTVVKNSATYKNLEKVERDLEEKYKKDQTL